MPKPAPAQAGGRGGLAALLSLATGRLHLARHSRRLLPPDRANAVDPAVKRRNHPNPRALRRSDQIRANKIQLLHLVQLDGPMEESNVDHANSAERQNRAQRLSHKSVVRMPNTMCPYRDRGVTRHLVNIRQRA